MQAKVAGKTFPIYEPHESRERRYTGIPFRELLTAVYGNDWKKSEEVLFTCSDGYQPSVPVDRFLKHDAILVYEVAGEKFSLNNKLQNEKNIDLNPFYLVWDNVKHPQLKEEGATFWPYQLTGVDLIQFQDRFPRMAPPPGSASNVKRGYLAFRAKCASCHTVNGEGAPKAVELNYPASVTEYFKPAWLEKWILSPTSLRFNTTMPALEGKDAKAVAKDIIVYLQAMARHKKPPKEEH